VENRSTGRRSRRRGREVTEAAPPKPDAFHLHGGFEPRPRFGFLDNDAIDELKRRAFELLENYGVVVIHPVAAEALVKAGAKPGDRADSLKLPRKMVEDALEITPKSVSLYGKTPAHEIHLPRKDNGFIMRTGTGGHGYVCPETSNYRNLDLAAAKEIAAVASDLDQVGFIAHPFINDVPEITSDVHGFAQMMRHTDKHCWMQPYAKENIEYLMRISVTAAGGEDELRQRPLASCITCSFTPLEFKYMDTEVIIQASRHGLPLHLCSLPSAGGTAPLTTAGMVLMAAAEILAMLTITQVITPGASVIATPLMFTLDMRTGSALQSCAESLQAASMAIQLMKHGFGLPAHTYGAGSDTPDVDVQSMAERAMLAQTIALSGADILGGVGQLECATVFSPVQAVLDNEIGGVLRQFIRTPDISDESLNWDEISSIRTGGHFLDSSHTLKYCREQHTPDVFMRQGRDDYEAANRRTAFDQARDKALQSIRNAPEDGVLSEEASKEIIRIVAEGEKNILEEAAGDSGTTNVI